MAKQREIEHVKREVESAVASAMRAHPNAAAVIVIPILIGSEPREPWHVWMMNRYEGRLS